MRISRRRFLQTMPVLAGLAAGFPLPAAQAGPAATRRLIVGSKSSACIIDLASGQLIRLPLGFMPHSFVRNPRWPDRVWAVERWDYQKPPGLKESVAEIDLREGKVLRQFAAPAGSGFFGHGFFTPDGKVFFISCVEFEKGVGHLTGYDTEDFKPVADYQIQPGAVHQCTPLEDGTVLAACSGIRPLKGLSHLPVECIDARR